MENASPCCAVDNKTLGNGLIAGDEYLHDMRQVRLDEDGVAR